MNGTNSIGLFTVWAAIGLGLHCGGCQRQEAIRPRGNEGSKYVRFKADVVGVERDAGGNLCAHVVLWNRSDFPVLLALQPPQHSVGGFRGPGACYWTRGVELLPPGTTDPPEYKWLMRKMVSGPMANQDPEKFVLVYNPDKSGVGSCCARYSYEMDMVIAPKETLDEIAKMACQTGERVRIRLNIQVGYVENCQAIVNGDASPLGTHCVAMHVVETSMCMDFTKAGDIVLVRESKPDTRPASQAARVTLRR
ncbi:MAG: hypothetical protein WCK05_06470 [Planctomycetota bacterium]